MISRSSFNTSYSNSVSQPPRKSGKSPAPAKNGLVTPSGDSVKFGRKRQNVIWVTTERIPAKMGGLGEVSKTIPEAIAQYDDGAENDFKDARVIVPYQNPHRADDEKCIKAGKPEDAFQPTNLTIRLDQVPPGISPVFQVLQKFEPVFEDRNKPRDQQRGNWVYAIKNDYFTKYEKENEKDKSLYLYTYKPDGGSLEKTMVFNQVAAKLIPYLKQSGPAIPNAPKQGQAELHRFNGDVDCVIGNDWLSGPVLYQDEIQNDRNIHKIFMLHNTYDSAPDAPTAQQKGFRIPAHLTKPTELYSPLGLSLLAADRVIANRNYVNTIVNTPFGQGEKFVKILKDHLVRGTVQDMHHGLAEDFTPMNNADLKVSAEIDWQKAKDKAAKEKKPEPPRPAVPYQFEELQEDTRAGWQRFKQVNKAALQGKYGLNQDPDATIVGWAARLEPRQKGFYMVQNTMQQLLDQYPKLQIIVAGNTDEPSVAEWIKRMSERYQGRLFMPNRFVSKDEITQISAGSDFTILPSLYEPYGLTQLEAMKMGSIPVVHGVDGIRSTVSDLPVNGKDFIGSGRPDRDEIAWTYGQTGILMRPMDGEKVLDTSRNRPGKTPYSKMVKAVDVPGYQNALDYERTMRTIEWLVSKEKPVYQPTEAKAKEAFKANAKEMAKLIDKLLVDHEKRLAANKRPLFDVKDKTETQQLRQLRDQLLSDSPKFTFEQKQKVFDRIIRHHIVDAAFKPAEASYLDAMKRAMALSAEERADIRANAIRFVEDQHKWRSIVENRYNPVIDSDHDYKAPKIEFHKNPPFNLEELTRKKKLEEHRKQLEAAQQERGQAPGVFQQIWNLPQMLWNGFLYTVSFRWLREYVS